MKWGLVPFWAPDPSIGNWMINARAETLMEKPSFKRLVEQQRCLVPADGFYEWPRYGNQRFPMLIRLKNKEPFAFAGLWDSWRNSQLPEEVLNTFTIITTDPNTRLKQIHNRMPVIYDQEMGQAVARRGCRIEVDEARRDYAATTGTIHGSPRGLQNGQRAGQRPI